jgi:hypothetical protein
MAAMTKLNPDLLASFARVDDAYAASLAEEDEYLRWIEEGQPEVDGLAPEDAAVLAARPLTAQLAAKREGVCYTTVLRWLKRRELMLSDDEKHHAYMDGGHWKIPEEALERRRAEKRKPQEAPEPKKRRRRRSPDGKPTTGKAFLS